MVYAKKQGGLNLWVNIENFWQEVLIDNSIFYLKANKVDQFLPYNGN